MTTTHILLYVAAFAFGWTIGLLRGERRRHRATKDELADTVASRDRWRDMAEDMAYKRRIQRHHYIN